MTSLKALKIFGDYSPINIASHPRHEFQQHHCENLISQNENIMTVISGFYHSVNEVCHLMGFYAE